MKVVLWETGKDDHDQKNGMSIIYASGYSCDIILIGVATLSLFTIESLFIQFFHALYTSVLPVGTVESLSSSGGVKVKSLYILIYLVASRMEKPQACIPPVNCSSDIFKGCTSSGFAEVHPASYGKAQSWRSCNTTSIHIQGRTSHLIDLSKDLINLTEACIFAEIHTILKMDLREGFYNSPTLTTHTLYSVFRICILLHLCSWMLKEMKIARNHFSPDHSVTLTTFNWTLAEYVCLWTDFVTTIGSQLCRIQ